VLLQWLMVCNQARPIRLERGRLTAKRDERFGYDNAVMTKRRPYAPSRSNKIIIHDSQTVAVALRMKLGCLDQVDATNHCHDPCGPAFEIHVRHAIQNLSANHSAQH
jgi:hypothetical protein